MPKWIKLGLSFKMLHTTSHNDLVIFFNANLLKKKRRRRRNDMPGFAIDLNTELRWIMFTLILEMFMQLNWSQSVED